jgi:probable F420-dependent oxidoreductase
MRPELGFYALAGAPPTARTILEEVREGEALGLGTAWVSERWNVKEAASLTGAAGAVTERLRIGTAATNHTTRHPIITASWASTMHSLTGGRFVLGLGRGVRPLFDAFGMAPITTAQLEDVAGLLRRLWRGETVVDHDGPAGRFPMLRLDERFDLHVPLALTAFGPQTLALAGRAFDEVVLHTFFTDETLVRCVATVKRAAEEAGRDPAAVRVWSVFATVGDHLPEEVRLKKTVGRLATYLQLYGDLMVTTNRWDPEVLRRFRADPVVQGFGRRLVDAGATQEELEHLATLLPDAWLAPAATGAPERCARAVRGQLDLGADAVVLHGATPAELRPVVEAYDALSTP